VKQFACGSVVDGCSATFEAQSEPEILAQVSEHARDAHGLTDVPPELQEIRQKIRDA